MTAITAADLTLVMENTFTLIIDDFKQNMSVWDENSISGQVVLKLARLMNGLTVSGLSSSENISASAWKLRGHLETLHGDIGVLVHISKLNGTKIDGVGFLEAKKRKHPSSHRFDAIKAQQLTDILSVTPLGYLLLYDYDEIDGYSANIEVWAAAGFNYSTLVPHVETHMVVLPLSTAVKINEKSTRLYPFSYPLTHQIISRYMRGFDLHTEEDLIMEVTGYGRRTGPQYLIQINIEETNVDGKGGTPKDGTSPKPNIGQYEKLEEPEDGLKMM